LRNFKLDPDLTLFGNVTRLLQERGGWPKNSRRDVQVISATVTQFGTTVLFRVKDDDGTIEERYVGFNNKFLPKGDMILGFDGEMA
jgi:hypothetical protein